MTTMNPCEPPRCVSLMHGPEECGEIAEFTIDGRPSCRPCVGYFVGTDRATLIVPIGNLLSDDRIAEMYAAALANKYEDYRPFSENERVLIENLRATNPPPSSPNDEPVLLAGGFFRNGASSVLQSVQEESAAAMMDRLETWPDRPEEEDALDEEELQAILDDYLALAFWFLESSKDRMPIQHARLAHVGITFATDLSDALKQHNVVPTSTAATREHMKRATQLVKSIIDAKPRILRANGSSIVN